MCFQQTVNVRNKKTCFFKGTQNGSPRWRVFFFHIEIHFPKKSLNYSSWWFFANPFWKICDRQHGFLFPNFRGDNKKYLKPPASIFVPVWDISDLYSPSELLRIQGLIKNIRFKHLFIIGKNQFWSRHLKVRYNHLKGSKIVDVPPRHPFPTLRLIANVPNTKEKTNGSIVGDGTGGSLEIFLYRKSYELYNI